MSTCQTMVWYLSLSTAKTVWCDLFSVIQNLVNEDERCWVTFDLLTGNKEICIVK